jgi:hypothetical protein
MLISQLFSWPAVNWPSTSTASQYTVIQLYPTPQNNIATFSGATSYMLSFDESVPAIYQVRPTSGSEPSLTYGPEAAVFVVGYVPCRAWLRQKIRMALSDRTDTVGTTINWPDSELNEYITEGINELNVLFPVEADTTISMLPPTIIGGQQVGTRDYTLPADYYSVFSVGYNTADGRLKMWLREKPFKGGESSATSILGYPKLGIMLSPQSGRFYPGHYEIYKGALHLDFDPAGDGDTVYIHYSGRRALPMGDADILALTPEDMELVSLRTQMKSWLRVESQDTRLSRWRTREDGSKRDDMPTLKHSDVIKKLYNELVNDRRELRPRVFRLVRR